MTVNTSKHESLAGVVVNKRVLGSGLTGQPRYLAELLPHLPGIGSVMPARPLSGPAGHLWEQAVLPLRSQGRLLWSPSTTGPLMKAHQVVTIHDTAPLDHPEWFARDFARLYTWLVPRLARRARRVIAISEFTKERVIQWSGIDADRVVVALNGVNERFRPQETDAVSAIKERLGLPERYVLTLGSVEPRKNLATLVQAWDAIPGRVKQGAQLVVAGARGSTRVFGDAGLDLRARDVFFTGSVDDALLPSLYTGATFFVFPSLYEGFGLPPLEAMACGTPVITCDRTAVPEVVGDAGTMVDPEDPEMLKEALESFLGDPLARETASARGLERAATFTWSRAGATVRTVLEKCQAVD